MISLPVDPAFRGLPLLDYLGVLWVDRSKDPIKALFANGAVRSRGRPVSPLTLAGDCESIEVHADPAGLPAIDLAPGELESGVKLVYEDARVSVLDKPSGIPVVPDRARASTSCLGFLLQRELDERRAKPAAEYVRPRVVHRIDRLTSGLVVLARTLRAEVEISGMFERSEIRKEYLALLTGDVAPARIAVDIGIGPGRKGKMRAGPAGKPSLTEFDVIERFPGFTLVRARPRTGRTHQIRLHAWAIGHPLAVDRLYRTPPWSKLPGPPGIDRLTLHAARIVLPESWGEPRRFEVPVSADLAAAVAALSGRQAGAVDCRLSTADC